MDYRAFTLKRAPSLTRLRSLEDINGIEFIDGVAEVEVPIELLDQIPLKHSEREYSPRLERVVQAIRRDGYSTLDPIICRVGALGNWVVIDGGHRITAAKRVSREFFTNLFGEKVHDLTFILFQTPMSYSKLKPAPGLADDGPDRRHHDIPRERRERHRRKKLLKQKKRS